MPENARHTAFWRYFDGGWDAQENSIIAEVPVSLTVNAEVWITFMCTPLQLEALAAGFLYNEGFIQSSSDIADVRVCENGTNIDVWTTIPLQKPAHWQRTSGCTGGVSSPNPQNPGAARYAENGPSLTPQAVLTSMEQLAVSQSLYRESRGVHCSALSDGQNLRLLAEDIGRHNTVDKLTGLYLLQKETFTPTLVITTGRISSEMLRKSARLGALAVASRTSPTTLSIEMAEEMGLTLIGYVRGNRFNVYTHPERLCGLPCFSLPESVSSEQPSSRTARS
jgi:FdhD protein